MKHRFIYIMMLLVFSGCSLEEDRESFADRANSYKNPFQAEAVVKSCYSNLHQIFNSNSAMMMEIATDLWFQNTSVVDAICAISPSRSGSASRIWKQCYNGIMRANEVIECTMASDLDEDVKMRIQAEARVLRAMFYYYLTNTFNGVPYYDYMVADLPTMEKIRKLPRTDASVIRQTLYDDLKDNAIPYFTEENGLKKRTSEVKGNRAGYAMGLMMMAKFAMWNKDWDAALLPLEALEELYGELTEANYPLDETVWWKKNTNESIFEIQHEWKSDGIQFSNTLCTNMYPVISDDQTLDGVLWPRWGVNLSRHTCARTTYHFACFKTEPGRDPIENTNAKYRRALFRPLPLTFGKYNDDWGRFEAVIDQNAEKTLTVRGEKVDKRVFYVLGLGNFETGETFNNIKEYGYAYGGMKFWIPNRTANYDSNNYKLFRYADAVLMMAECWCMKGEFDKALKYLNYTRARACVDSYTEAEYSTEKAIMQLVMDERARELGGELHRKYDMVRWGTWYTETKKQMNSTAYILKYIQPHHEYYPIPDTECALSNYVLTNPTYEGAPEIEGDFEDDI